MSQHRTPCRRQREVYLRDRMVGASHMASIDGQNHYGNHLFTDKFVLLLFKDLETLQIEHWKIAMEKIKNYNN